MVEDIALVVVLRKAPEDWEVEMPSLSPISVIHNMTTNVCRKMNGPLSLECAPILDVSQLPMLEITEVITALVTDLTTTLLDVLERDQLH